jgi:hypothetical protein
MPKSKAIGGCALDLAGAPAMLIIGSHRIN